MNALDIILLLLMAAVIILAIRQIRADRRNGKSCLGCGGNCSSCGINCSSCGINSPHDRKETHS